MELSCGCGEYHDNKCPVAKVLRNCWCTPKWLAKLIGWVDIDPCSNERSHIKAAWVSLNEADDGLTYNAKAHDVAFINPPYAHGEVIKWIRAYAHTRFIFLLRWDPSTDWFGELIPQCDWVWFPPSRINFEPPPRIRESSNPYPHALYLRDPSEELLGRLRTAGYLFRVDRAFIAAHTAANDNRPAETKPSDRVDGNGKASARRARRRGGGAGEVPLGPKWQNPNPEATKRWYSQQLEIPEARRDQPGGAEATGDEGTAGTERHPVGAERPEGDRHQVGTG